MFELFITLLIANIIAVTIVILVIKNLKQIIKLIPKSITNDYNYLSEIAKRGGILFLGDSITEFYNVGGFYSGYLVHNRGVAGNTTEQLFVRLYKNVYPIKPNKIFLLIGTNDLGQGKTVDETVEGCISIINALKENLPKSKLYVESILPVNDNISKISKRMVGVRCNRDIDLVNEKVQGFCKEKNIDYIDLNSHLKDESGKLDISFTFDGLHPNFDGYIKITSLLESYVKDNKKEMQK